MTGCHPLEIIAAFIALLFLGINSGCTKSDGKVAVSGQVSFRGQPIERAALTFHPDAGRPETAAVESGQYRTLLMPGSFTATVLISPTLPPNYKEGDKLPAPDVVLPDGYTSRMKSTLKATVSPAQSEPINFDLK